MLRRRPDDANSIDRSKLKAITKTGLMLKMLSRPAALVRQVNLRETYQCFRDWYWVTISDVLSLTRLPALIGMGRPATAWSSQLRSGIQVRMRPAGKDTYVAREIWNDHAYTPEEFRDSAQAGIVLDIGAHIGVFSLFALHRGFARELVAYEPDPDNFQLLQENLALNGYSERVHLTQAAVAGERGARKLSRKSIDPGANRIVSSWLGGESLEVEAITLADCFRDHDIDRCSFLKMDIEGAEYEVMEACPDEILDCISALSMECHQILTNGQSFQGLMRRLQSSGFATTFAPITEDRGMVFATRQFSDSIPST